MKKEKGVVKSVAWVAVAEAKRIYTCEREEELAKHLKQRADQGPVSQKQWIHVCTIILTIFRCNVKFFRAFPETPLNMNARALLSRRCEMGFVRGGDAGMLLD